MSKKLLLALMCMILTGCSGSTYYTIDFVNEGNEELYVIDARFEDGGHTSCGFLMPGAVKSVSFARGPFSENVTITWKNVATDKEKESVLKVSQKNGENKFVFVFNETGVTAKTEFDESY